MPKTTKSRREVELEVERLKKQVADFKQRETRFSDLETQLERTLEDLNTHQEELRSQNEELLFTRERLESLLDKYSVLFLDSPVAYLVFDRWRTIVETNHAAAELLGLGKTQLVGKPILPYVPREIRKKLEAHFQRVVRFERANDELQLLKNLKTPVHCLFESRLIRDPQKDRPLCLTVIFDITERKRTEDRISELAERNARILDSAAEGILGIDHQRRIIFANASAANLLGHPVEDLVGRDIRRLLRPLSSDGDPLAPGDDAVNETLRDGKSRSILDGYLHRRRGIRFPASYTVSPTFQESGVTGLVFTFRDDTERKEIEASLKRPRSWPRPPTGRKAPFWPP